jgi:hypothetical protein
LYCAALVGVAATSACLTAVQRPAAKAAPATVVVRVVAPAPGAPVRDPRPNNLFRPVLLAAPPARAKAARRARVHAKRRVHEHARRRVRVQAKRPVRVHARRRVRAHRAVAPAPAVRPRTTSPPVRELARSPETRIRRLAAVTNIGLPAPTRT